MMTRTKHDAASSLRLLSSIFLISMILVPSLVRGKILSQTSSFWSPGSSPLAFSFGGRRRNNNKHNSCSMILASIRGGSTDEVEMTEEDDDATGIVGDESDEDESDEDEEEETTSKKTNIHEPVRLIISTNWGNAVIDQKVELTPLRTRDIASIKKSLSKQLTGRPPILALDLIYEGRILDDETLVEELFEDDDEEDDEDEDVEEGNQPSRTLTLNLVPPVDPKFATDLAPKLLSNDDDDYAGGSPMTGDGDCFTTDELVDAYYMNQAAMSRNAQLLANPNDPSPPLQRLELQEQARQLREQLQSETPVDVWEKCMEVADQKGNGTPQEERRGQRYRSSKGGASTQLKTIIQTNMNVDWREAIKYSMLFLFLGYFGGKDSFSRYLLYWGAPLSFAVQARPAKILFKTLFYMLCDPPRILLSFLPAPHQAILSVDLKASCATLYGEDGANLILGLDEDESASSIVDESESEEIDEDEYDSEEEIEEDEYDSDDE